MDTHRDTIDLVHRRTLDAPVERVWQAWTDCEILQRWWGPREFTSPTCEIDLRTGGSYLFSMRSPESQGGQVYYSTGQYEEIDPPHHLVFGDYFADAAGRVVPAEEMGMGEGFPAQPRMIIDFAADGDRTVMTIRHPGWQPGSDAELASQGLDESLDKLERVLAMTSRFSLSADPGLPYIDTIADYDAPLEQVFRAHVDPTLIVEWMGPASLRWEVLLYDARTGGSWSFRQTDTDGSVYAFRGVFHEVAENKRIVQTFEWETSASDEHVLLDRTDFEELPGGRTRVRTHTVMPSVALRDAELEDMRSGWHESFARLTALLAGKS